MFRSDERTRVVEAAVDDPERGVGAEARALGARRVLLVSDPGVAAAGHVARARTALEKAGVAVQTFFDVHENPTTDDVARGLAVAQALQPEAFVAVGGGSAIDAAKGVNFLHVCGGEMADYWGHDKATSPLLPLLVAPTTAGTGSEVQSFALISDAATHRKMACGDPSAAPRVAILDPSLTVTMPRFVTACTGLDTIAHAVESAVAKPRDPNTDGRSKPYAREALRLALEALPRVLEAPGDLDARASMLRASALAGFAIEHAMLGVAHSIANPLTRHHGVVHGLAVGTLLPHVVRFNAEDTAARAEYERLANAAGVEGGAEGLATRLADLLVIAGVPSQLEAHGVAASGAAALAAEAAEQWTAQFNPRIVDAADLQSLIETAL